MKKTKYWILAARPKTLSAALIPVLTATALAYADGRFAWLPALLCCLFAAWMQIAANFINDLFDYQKGTDNQDRLGPERACAQGWISPKEMKRGIAFVLTVACICGLGLLPFGGSKLLILGIGCVVFAFLYTTLLSYVGCGDVLVWVFFGFVPVCGTYFVQSGSLNASVLWLSAACGLVTDTLLVLNNYRDREQDAISGKKTLIVVCGERFGSQLYLWQGILGCACAMVLAYYGHTWAGILSLLYLILHILTWREMIHIYKGRELNRILGKTSRNMLIFALLVVVSLLIK